MGYKSDFIRRLRMLRGMRNATLSGGSRDSRNYRNVPETGYMGKGGMNFS